MMDCLTLTQPWATVVGLGLKPVENRDWKLPDRLFNQDFAIHSSQKFDNAAAKWIIEHFPDNQAVCDAVNGTHKFGYVLAVARLAGYLHDGRFHSLASSAGMGEHDLINSPWFFGKFGFVLEDVRTLSRPVAAKGMQKFWKLPLDVEQAVRAQLAT